MPCVCAFASFFFIGEIQRDTNASFFYAPTHERERRIRKREIHRWCDKRIRTRNARKTRGRWWSRATERSEKRESFEREEEERVLCLRIPDYDVEDDDEMDEQIREEEMTVRKGSKRKRTQQHECDVCEKVFR